MRFLSLDCPSCGETYQLPASLRPRLTAAEIECARCSATWVPYPSAKLLDRLLKKRPARLPIDLTPYREHPTGFGIDARALAPGLLPAAPAAPAPVASVPMATDAPLPPPNLRVLAKGPEVDTKNVWDTGERAFLIGKERCHLHLPDAQIPMRAIRIRRRDGRFSVEGIDGFTFHVGGAPMAQADVPEDEPIVLRIDPYLVTLEATSAPGAPVAALDTGDSTASRTFPGRDLRGDSDEGTVLDFRQRKRTTKTAAVAGGTMLLGIGGPADGQTFRLDSPSLTIGRAADVRLPDPKASAKHARIDVYGPGDLSVSDLASTNGTFVNERPVTQARLRAGDHLKIGDSVLKVIVKS